MIFFDFLTPVLAQLQKMDFSQPCDEYELDVLDVSPINRVTKGQSERELTCAWFAPWQAVAPPRESHIDRSKQQVFMQHDI